MGVVSAWRRKHCPRGRRSLLRDTAKVTLEKCANVFLRVKIETVMDDR